jgi:ssDNA-binding replication factor A large subunit
MQNKEILGPGTGTVRVGFARDPTYNPDEVIQDVVISGNTITSYATPNQMLQHSTSTPAVKKNQQEKPETTNTTQWATVIMMASMMMNAQQKQQQQSGNSLSNTDRLAAEREFIMKQLGYEPKLDEGKKKKDKL